MPDSESPVVQIDDLSVSLSNHSILEKVSFEVRPAAIHFIVGPNGAGKTTLMRCLIGALPHRGQIRFRFRRQGGVGYVPQTLHFDPALPMTVADFFHILVSRRPVFFGRSDKLKRRIGAWLSQTGCEHLTDRSLGSLSGGELRRVLIAQALVKQPEILLLDEPNSNMDESAALNFERLLRELRDRHALTLVMVAHDFNLTSRLADDVTCINKRLVFSEKANVIDWPAFQSAFYANELGKFVSQTGTSGLFKASGRSAETA